MPRNRRKAPPSPTKASESVVSRMLAKVLGVPQCDTVEGVCISYTEGTDVPLVDLTNKIVGLYSWNCSVAREIMSPETSPLVEHLISRPGQAFVVKDTDRQGADSLWVAIADPPYEFDSVLSSIQCRGLLHTFKVGDEYSRVIAIQINSCRQ